MREAHDNVGEADRGLTACQQQRKAIGTLQELLGHKDLKTQMIHTHVLNCDGHCVKNPTDAL